MRGHVFEHDVEEGGVMKREVRRPQLRPIPWAIARTIEAVLATGTWIIVWTSFFYLLSGPGGC